MKIQLESTSTPKQEKNLKNIIQQYLDDNFRLEEELKVKENSWKMPHFFKGNEASLFPKYCCFH